MPIIKGQSVNISKDAKIADNTVIWDYVNIAGDVTIGENSVIGSHCDIIGVGLPVVIGNGVHMQSNCFVPGGSVIGDNVFLGPGTIITNDPYPPSSSSKDWKPVTIKANAVIGAGTTVCPGAVIGENVKVAAGSVVLGKVYKPNRIIGGNPARKILAGNWSKGVDE